MLVKVAQIIKPCATYQKEAQNAIFNIKIFIRQLKQIENSNPRFRILSDDMITCFVQADVVGEEGDRGGGGGGVHGSVV